MHFLPCTVRCPMCRVGIVTTEARVVISHEMAEHFGGFPWNAMQKMFEGWRQWTSIWDACREAVPVVSAAKVATYAHYAR